MSQIIFYGIDESMNIISAEIHLLKARQQLCWKTYGKHEDLKQWEVCANLANDIYVIEQNINYLENLILKIK